jgi:hypothetical protein
MASRSADKASEAIAKIEGGYDFGINNCFIKGPKLGKAASGKLVFLRVDLADLDSVEEMVQEIKTYASHSLSGTVLIYQTGKED